MFLSPQMARASASRRVSPRAAASPRTVPKTRANELRVFEDGSASPMFSSPVPAHALHVLSSLGDTDLDAYDPASLLMPTVVELRAEQQRFVTRLLVRAEALLFAGAEYVS